MQHGQDPVEDFLAPFESWTELKDHKQCQGLYLESAQLQELEQLDLDDIKKIGLVHSFFLRQPILHVLINKVFSFCKKYHNQGFIASGILL